MTRLAALALAALTAFAASAQSRGPVLPNYQDPSKQAPAAAPAPAAKSDDVDLVGPTEKQQARAKAAAEAKAKADADAKLAAEKKARDEADAKARAEADKKAKADADARAAADKKARDEADAKARLAAEAKAKADKDAKARDEAEARLRADDEARAKARAEADAAKRRSVEDAQARANAAAEAAKQKALEAVLAQRRAAEEARAAARAAAEAKRVAREQMQAAAREEARARKADQEAKAKARALLVARKRDEARCGKGKKAQACLAAVAEKYEAPSLPLSAAPAAVAAAAPAPDALAIAPLVANVPAAAPAAASAAPAPAVVAAAPAADPSRAVLMPGSPTPPPPAKPLETLAAGDRKVLLPPGAPAPAAAPAAAPAPVAAAPAPAAAPASVPTPAGVRLASATIPATAAAPAPRPVANTMMSVPRDEQQRRPRAAEVVNDLQIGPQSLILDNLKARGDIVPGGVQLDFGYRLAVDDATAAHHLFSLGVSSARCQSDACGVRWFLRGGLGPRNSNNYGVERRVNGVNVAQTDQLGWAANVLQGGLGYSGATAFVLADAQLEALAEDYLQNVMSTNPPAVHGALQQWRFRGTAGLSRGIFSGQVRVAGYAYGGDSTDSFKNVPVRGALIEDDLPGLAGALQSFSARAEATLQIRRGTDLSASYGYIGYVGPTWSSANIFAASIGQKLGSFRLALGVVYELEQDAQGNGYPTTFGTGSLGASF